MARRSRVRFRQRSSPARRGDFLYGVLVLVAVAHLRRRGRHRRRGAGCHRRAHRGWTAIVKERRQWWLKGRRRCR